jgi:hypothetical protein
MRLERSNRSANLSTRTEIPPFAVFLRRSGDTLGNSQFLNLGKLNNNRYASLRLSDYCFSSVATEDNYDVAVIGQVSDIAVNIPEDAPTVLVPARGATAGDVIIVDGLEYNGKPEVFLYIGRLDNGEYGLLSLHQRGVVRTLSPSRSVQKIGTGHQGKSTLI